MARCMAIVVVPEHDAHEPRLPLLTRARLLIYPYIRSSRCEKRIESAGECGCGCLWDNAIVGRDSNGILWRDRYGLLPADHPVADPEDEPRLVADVSLRNTSFAPSALITPGGQIHHLGGDPAAWGYTMMDLALLEDRLMEYPDCYAVPFSCRL